MLASAGSGKTYRPSRTCEVSFWKTSSISVRARPSRKTTSTSCEISLTPETTSVRPGTRAVIRPSPRGALCDRRRLGDRVRRVSTGTNEAIRSGACPSPDRRSRPKERTVACPPLERSVSLPFSTVTVARSSISRASHLPPIFGSTSPVRPATSMRTDRPSRRSCRACARPPSPAGRRCRSSDVDDDRAVVAKIELVAGPSSNDARAPRALLTSVPGQGVVLRPPPCTSCRRDRTSTPRAPRARTARPRRWLGSARRPWSSLHPVGRRQKQAENRTRSRGSALAGCPHPSRIAQYRPTTPGKFCAFWRSSPLSSEWH